MPGRLFEALRDALSAHPPSEAAEPPGYRPASVLVPIHPREDEVEFVFVQRSEELRHHPGQIAFPGGSREPDGENALDCALREAEEEVGLAPARVEVLGAVEPCLTPTGFSISPFVGRISVEPATLRPDPVEIARIFTLPLGELVETGAYRKTLLAPDKPLEFFVCRDEVIWGATARILRQVLELARGERLRPEGPIPWDRIRF